VHSTSPLLMLLLLPFLLPSPVVKAGCAWCAWEGALLVGGCADRPTASAISHTQQHCRDMRLVVQEARGGAVAACAVLCAQWLL
jgi:hypothetical protein